MSYHHISVLLREAVDALRVQDHKVYLDATFGGGGHTTAILESNPTCRVVAFDVDKEAIRLNAPRIKEQFGDRFTVVWGNFAHCYKLLRQEKIHALDGVLADFGTSQHQIKTQDGFSFSHDTPLDMRMSKSHNYFSAEYIVNRFSPKDLANIFFTYGEERFGRKIADAICTQRSIAAITTTRQLANLIEKVIMPKPGQRIHVATKTFQALRIFVNKELDNIELFLKNILPFLRPKGVLACISFHSLEDRIVKSFFRDHPDTLETITRKPITPADDEIALNPASRSGKLRVAVKRT